MILAYLVSAVLMQPVTGDAEETACYERDQSQQAMNICAGEAYQRADKALNAEWQKLLTRYGDDPKAKKLLLDGQRAWLTYRDSTCEMAAYDVIGGSLWPLVNSGCLARLTRERTTEMGVLLEGEGN